jgi:hypothetical protein
MRNKLIRTLKQTHFLGWFFLYCTMEKEHQIFGIRAIMRQYNLAQLLMTNIFKKKQVANL